MASLRYLSMFLLLQTILFSNLYALDNFPPSYDPPGGLAVDSCPIFIVLGFDDNRYVDGMEWVLNLLQERTNPQGTGNPETFDGLPIIASFYYISGALDEDTDGSLLETWKLAYERGHEVANHTVSHNTSNSLSKEAWVDEMQRCRARLSLEIGIPETEIVGFRTPYLAYNSETFKAIKELGMLYDCTMTQHQNVGRKQFYWPYTLDNGFAGQSLDSGLHVIEGQWQIPAYTFGAWDDAYPMWPPIVTFDHSMLTQAYGADFEQYLKNTIDFRMLEVSNRAPITVGLHSDVYTDDNTSANETYKINTTEGRRAALANFIDYALTFPNVRFVSAIQLIEWMRNPVPLGRTPVTGIKTASSNKYKMSVILLNSSNLSLSVPLKGSYNLELFNVSGKRIRQIKNLQCKVGENCISLNKYSLSKGSYIVKVTGMNIKLISPFIF